MPASTTPSVTSSSIVTPTTTSKDSRTPSKVSHTTSKGSHTLRRSSRPSITPTETFLGDARKLHKSLSSIDFSDSSAWTEHKSGLTNAMGRYSRSYSNLSPQSTFTPLRKLFRPPSKSAVGSLDETARTFYTRLTSYNSEKGKNWTQAQYSDLQDSFVNFGQSLYSKYSNDRIKGRKGRKAGRSESTASPSLDATATSALSNSSPFSEGTRSSDTAGSLSKVSSSTPPTSVV